MNQLKINHEKRVVTLLEIKTDKETLRFADSNEDIEEYKSLSFDAVPSFEGNNKLTLIINKDIGNPLDFKSIEISRVLLNENGSITSRHYCIFYSEFFRINLSKDNIRLELYKTGLRSINLREQPKDEEIIIGSKDKQ